MATPTSITINAYPIPLSACQSIIPPPTGVLMDEDLSLPIPNEVITVKYNGNTLGTDITDINGTYTILNVYILEAGTFTLEASFAGDATYDPCSIDTPITIEYCEGDEDLTAGFFANHYRTPRQIKDSDCWGAILCIDPNSLRTDQKGPIYYLLDTCVLRPGLTDKAGGFAGTVNDNKTSIASDGTQKRIYDMTLFEAETVYVRDNDEFWLGVQEGPISDPWSPGVGGRYWFMGGYITKRYYTYDIRTQIIANIEGKCYMDLWKENFFGTDDIPRNYDDEAVDILQVVMDVLHDMNAAQDSDYEFRSHPDNFPGSHLTTDVAFGGNTITVVDTTPFQTGNAFIWDSENYTGETIVITVIPSATQLTIAAPGIVYSEGYSIGEGAGIVMSSDLTGIPFLRNFNNNPMFSVMQDFCERAEYEWKIAPYPTGTTSAARRSLEFYPRISAPMAGNPYITYGGNIRQLPSIMVGDTTNLVTNALVTGKPITFPEDITTWINSRAWNDKSSRNRYYSIGSSPPPPNAYSQALADSSLILDDEGLAALNVQKDNEPIFDISLSYYAETSDIAVATLDMDLRKWRRLKFHFRHATAESPTITLTVTNYLNLVGSTITLVTASNNELATRQGIHVVHLVEGVDWTAAVDNNTTAASILIAIRGSPVGSNNVWATAAFPSVIVQALGWYWLTYISSTATVGLTIDTSEVNLYRFLLQTYNPDYASTTNLWNQAFYYEFGTGVKQSSTVFNDPVTSNHDIITGTWSEIDLLLPDVNTDGTIGDGNLADLYDDDYMHGWRPIFLTGLPNSPDTTADPTNIDFLGIYVNCKERGPGGVGAPGAYVRNLSGTNKNFVATLLLAAGASPGDIFLEVTNAYRMAGDYLMGPVPTEEALFYNPHPKYVIWRNSGSWEDISIFSILGDLFPGNDNVLLTNPLEGNYPNGEVLCRGGWNISFSQLHFTPGSIDKAPFLPANLANPKRFRLISSDDVEYLVDIEGLADQSLLDSAAYQAIKVTLDGDPRHRVGLRMIPQLDPYRAGAGLPTNFHWINMVIDSAEHHITAGCDFYSIFVLGTIDTRGKELVMAAISGQQETKLARTSYGVRSKDKYQRK